MGLVGALMIAGPAAAEVVSFDVEAQSAPRITLTAELTKPNGNGPFAAVVMLHGCLGMWKPWGDPWSERLKRWGYVALQVDSFGPRGYSEGVCGSPFSVGPQTRSADAHAAKVYLATVPYVDEDRIAVIGMSHGGWATLAAVENSYLDGPTRTDPFQAAVALYPHCTQVLYRLDAPLLILIGEADDWTWAFRCKRMEMKGPTRHALTLKVYSGATHSFDVDIPDRQYLGHAMKFHPSATRDAVARVWTFLSKHLGGI